MCKFNSSLNLFLLNNNFFFKIQKWIVDNCSCIDIDYPFYQTTFSSCIFDLDSLKCNEKQLEVSQVSSDFEQMCERLCPFECDSHEFSHTLTGNEVKYS
jgi:hypothetical protein